eukprot:CAMPEP_0176420348 /NCGR_PEP_ID=MMETSP0127-20121128/8558_1 /TAXON_ID=938130 /ORGANISM="Platyophrya macrostoma, Strain WH" /LENGTH=199 /DNA_ID=CAMNT_0017800937 /DNA_START=46 /DNA_END=641 /DNA_ORIENTATION=+
MLDELKSTTRKEILAAKKILYEGDNSSKSTYVTLLFALISLLLLLALCFFGTSDVWDCELDRQDTKYAEICRELRKAVNCRTITGPLKAEVLLNVDHRIKASADVVCPWEIAVSELRVCFCLLALLSVGIGMYAVRRESKKYADLYYQAGLFLTVVLAISSLFDWISINDAKINNHNFCTLSDEFQLHNNVIGESLVCT